MGLTISRWKKPSLQDTSLHSAKKSPTSFRKIFSTYLAGKGFSEIQTNSLTNPKYYKDLGLGGEPVEVLNKSSEDLGYMKTHIALHRLGVGQTQHQPKSQKPESFRVW